ncbi:transcriptional adapter 2B-like isoform X1 [Malaya genurostris]|uniref:transcriptional adapter 2B-like isoform X1 n=1 Tax=Malaya genurostris TaxID=325434 RepID=UPI0026F393A2|nr:transcriptional adapter 2B-like isoform X1 [Malaya genurostris]
MAELFAKYICTNCQEDVPGIRVHCAVCPDFELCLACFAVGAEIGPHRNDHAYQFMDSGILSIYQGKNGWSAREELHLLDAIEQYGFGNWEDISKHIETRTPEEAKDEYVSKFLNGSVGRNTWTWEVDHRPQLTDHTSDDTGPLGQLLTQRLPPMDCTNEEAAVLGYMPNRDDFEREYDPTAEQLVCTLSLHPDDEDVDMLLKLAQVDIYTRRLRERARRKRVVRDYQLVANFFRGNAKRARMTRDQREFRERLRTFSQFYTSQEFERLIATLERERSLRIRLSELNRYRWNGLQRKDDCVHFEQHAAAAQHRNTGPYGHGRTDNRSKGGSCETSKESLAPPSLPIARKSENDDRSSNSIAQKLTHRTVAPVSSEDSFSSKNYSDSLRETDPAKHQKQPRRGNQVFPDPAQQPGVQLLTSNELQLCNLLIMPVTRYLSLKTVLLGNPSLNHSSISSLAEGMVKKHLIKSGWL